MVRDGTGGRRHLISPTDLQAEDLRRLRGAMRAARRAVAPLHRRRASARIARRIARLPAFRRAGDLGLYLPHDGEIDPTGITRAAWRAGKRVWLPVVRPGGRMEFAPALPDGRLRRNRFGIPEPPSFRRGRRLATRLDLVIVPLVAFDRSGRRLGMGGGFYDRAFAATRRPPLLGIAFAAQEVGALPARPWDVPLDVIVTEREIIRAA